MRDVGLTRDIADAMFENALIASDNSEEAAEIAIQMTTASLARFKVADDYNGDTDLTHDCGWETGWSLKDSVTLGAIAEKAFAHDAECKTASTQWSCGRCGDRFPTQEDAQRHADSCTNPTMRVH